MPGIVLDAGDRNMRSKKKKYEEYLAPGLQGGLLEMEEQ